MQDGSGSMAGGRGTRRRGRLVLAGVLLGGLVALALVAPLRDWALLLQAWFDSAGAWGVVAYVLLFTCWNLLLPPMPLQLLAGWVYGLVWGTLYIYLGSTLAIVVAFLLARSALRQPLERALGRRPVWRAVDQAFAEEGWRAVVLLRLSNVLPSNLANIACGASGQRLWTVLWASWLGKFPGVLLTVLLGKAGRDALAGTGVASPWTWVTLTIGILATVLMTILLARRTRRILGHDVTQGVAGATV